jgi:aminotransferase
LEAIISGEEYVQKMVAEYDRRRRLIVSGMNEPGLPTFELRGAFYTFPAIDATGMDNESFAEALLMKERVAVIPGNAFGAGSNHVRCCYATSYEKIEQALERIQSFMKRHGYLTLLQHGVYEQRLVIWTISASHHSQVTNLCGLINSR